ncbi:hypothetical protein GCM10020256_12830 [Streptomyces thermocoprophilus]
MRPSKPAVSARERASCSWSRWGELVHSGRRQEGLEAEDAGLVQRAEVLDVVGQGAAPEADVDVGLVPGRLLLDAQVVHGGGGRQGVQGHVHEGGDAAGRRGAGGGPEALPRGAARVVDVDVGVDEAGQQHVVAVVLHAGTGGDVRVVREYGCDRAGGHRDGRGARALRGDDPP